MTPGERAKQCIDQCHADLDRFAAGGRYAFLPEITAAIRAAVAAETERCAQEAAAVAAEYEGAYQTAPGGTGKYGFQHPGAVAARAVASRIRAQGEER